LICINNGMRMIQASPHLNTIERLVSIMPTGIYTRKTTKQFIQESKNIHGNEFDYSKVQYKDSRLPDVLI
jgi:hypothetical protein